MHYDNSFLFFIKRVIIYIYNYTGECVVKIFENAKRETHYNRLKYNKLEIIQIKRR